MGADESEITETLEPIAYLSRSENRLQVLEALTETIPHPGLEPPGYEPRELRKVTGASEATISRILTEFEERGWAERGIDGKYTATPKAQGISIGFTPLIDSMKALQALGDAVALLPLNELTIGLENFHDATIRQPRGPQPGDFGIYLTELLNESSTLYALTYVSASMGLVDEIIERLDTGHLDQVTVWSDHIMDFALEAFDDYDDVRIQLQAGAEWYSYTGHIPCNVFIFDETVVFENSQLDEFKDGTAIECQNETVRTWALEMFERYRKASEEITVDDIPE